jgi:hypothetical protein
MRGRGSSALGALLFAAGVVAARDAHAVDIPLPGSDESFAIHGFISPGYILTTANNFLARSNRGSFDFAEVGLNFTVPLTDKLRAGIQLFAHKLGPIGNYSPKADWFYLDYRVQDYFGIRAGRVKLPFGLYNDTSDIDVARVPVLLPQSIYPATARDFLLAQTGGEIYGRVDMRAVGALEYRIYGGTIFVDANDQATANTQISAIDVPYVFGERVLWETPVEGLRLAGSLEALRLDITSTLPSAPMQAAPAPIALGVPAVLWVGSAEYARDRLLLSAEYSQWIVTVESSNPAAYPPGRTVSERGYAMASYRLNPWLEPAAYYSLYFPDIHNRDGRQQFQHDVAGTLRFDINPHWIVKLEGHFMSGTALLDSTLNANQPKSDLEKNWGVFLVKTTAYF